MKIDLCSCEVRASTGFEPVASAFALQFSTNRAMKTHTLEADQFIEFISLLSEFYGGSFHTLDGIRALFLLTDNLKKVKSHSNSSMKLVGVLLLPWMGC